LVNSDSGTDPCCTSQSFLLYPAFRPLICAAPAPVVRAKAHSEQTKVIVEEAALDYPLGRRLLDYARDRGIPAQVVARPQGVRIPGEDPRRAYEQAKQTLFAGLRRSLRFQTCRPSADYQLPLAGSCPHRCQYCYLQTTLGPRPYVRVYVNVEEILDAARRYMGKGTGTTTFEGSATSDPLALEHLTGSLSRAISFFGGTAAGRFRFVAKSAHVTPLLDLPHRAHTRVRFSLNTPAVIETYEHGTAPLKDRLSAAIRAAEAGYPTGFVIAPIIAAAGWQKAYTRLFATVADHARGTALDAADLTLEFISHRFTRRARNLILQRFPDTPLEMSEEGRRFRYGQFGYGKFVYPPELLQEMEALMNHPATSIFPRRGSNTSPESAWTQHRLRANVHPSLQDFQVIMANSRICAWFPH